MQTIDQINSDIDSALKDNPPRSSSPLLVRGILKKLALFVSDYTSDLAGRVASVAGVSAITSPTDGLPGVRYYPILELPASTGGTYDFADIRLTSKPWDGAAGGQSTHTNLYIGNRGGFVWEYTIQGLVDSTGLEAYQQADGRTIVYVKTDSGFRVWSVRVANFLLATVYPTTAAIALPSGNLKFSSLQPTIYRPLVSTRSRFTTFYSGNCDGAFPQDAMTTPGNAQLAIGANWTGGASEVDLINTNLNSGPGGGIAFWQLVTATTKKMLGYFDGSGNLTVNGVVNAKYVSNVTNPTTSSIPDGNWQIWRNTTNNEVRLWVNVGGTLKSTLLS